MDRSASPTQEIMNLNPQWIKIVSPDFHVEHVNWLVELTYHVTLKIFPSCSCTKIVTSFRVNQYNALRHALEMPAPGYVIHESATWSEKHRRSV